MKRVLIALAVVVIFAGNIFAATLPCERMLKKEECVQTKCATTGKACVWTETAAAPNGKCACTEITPKPCKEIKQEKECVQTKCKETSRPCNWIKDATGKYRCSCMPK